MPRRGYSELYEAIQEAFDPEDMTESRISSWLVHGDTGKHEVKWGKDDKGRQRTKEVEGKGISRGSRQLAKRLSATNKVAEALDRADSLEELDRLASEAKDLDVHSDTLLEEINARRTELEVAKQISEETISDAEVEKTAIKSQVRQIDKEARELEGKIEADEEQKRAIESEFPEEAEALQEDIDNERERLERRMEDKEELLEEIKKQEEILEETKGSSFKARHVRARAKRTIKKSKARLIKWTRKEIF